MWLKKYFYSRPATLREDQTFVLTTSVAVVCFPHFFEIPIWCTVIAIAFMCYRYLTDVGPRLFGIYVPRPNRWILYATAMFVTWLIYFSYGTLQGPEACTTLLVLLLCLKLNEAQKYWDAMIVLIISYFVSMCWLLFSQSLLTTVYLVFSVIYSTHSLMSLHAPRKLKGKLSAGFAFRDLLKAVPIFLLLFFMFPRFASPFAAMMMSPGAETGFSGDLNPGEISGLAQSNAVAFRVHFPGEKPSYKNLYWRGSALSEYSGMNWRKSKNQYREIDLESPEKAIVQEIVIEPRFNKWLFGLEMPVKATFTSSDIRTKIRLTEQGELRSTYPLAQPTMVKVLSVPDFSLEESDEEVHKNLKLFDKPSKEFQDLADKLKAHAATNLQIAEAGLRHFRTGGFVYSQLPGQIVTVDDFLFKQKKGFCEHYAATFATLMRAAGVPARVVVGFYGGVYNDYGNYLLVRDREAHAWTEIYLKGQGWHRIDPTSAVSPDRISYESQGINQDIMRLAGNMGVFEKTLLFFDYINSEYTRFLINFDSNKQIELLSDLGLNFTSNKQLLTLLGILILSVTVVIGYSTSGKKKKADRLAREYERLLKKLKKRGSHLTESMGPYEVLSEGRKALTVEGSEKLTKIINLYADARFSNSNSTSAAKDLKSLVSSF